MVGSMGNIGTAADNAAMESFFSLLQKNVFNQPRWTTRNQLRIAIVTWIERTYHRRRRQPALGRLTPWSTTTSSVDSGEGRRCGDFELRSSWPWSSIAQP